jgi:hypothetical protein
MSLFTDKDSSILIVEDGFSLIPMIFILNKAIAIDGCLQDKESRHSYRAAPCVPCKIPSFVSFASQNA